VNAEPPEGPDLGLSGHERRAEPPHYDIVPVRWPFRVRVLIARNRWVLWRRRVWMARALSPSEWRARYRGIKIFEQVVNERVSRAILFGE
jgi:hypothetical protein